MTELIHPAAASYAATYTSPTSELLREIEQFTQEHHAEPQMLSGPLQGKLLELISRMLQPRRILEIGTFMGYSALCLAMGLADGGELHTLELREKDAEQARRHFSKSLYGDRIFLHLGNALELIPSLAGPWDLVFIDADKVNYTNYYELTLPQVRPGGFLLADNVLFHGEVLENPISGRNAIAIDAFNRHVKQDSRVEHVLMTVRDGLMLIRKK